MEPVTNARTTSGDAPGSICPQGWTLPPNAGDGSYYNLLTTTYGFGNSDYAKLLAAPFDFAYTGLYSSSAGVLGYTDDGCYWSRTAADASYAYRFVFNSGYVNPQGTNSRGLGFPVRCVANP